MGANASSNFSGFAQTEMPSMVRVSSAHRPTVSPNAATIVMAIDAKIRSGRVLRMPIRKVSTRITI